MNRSNPLYNHFSDEQSQEYRTFYSAKEASHILNLSKYMLQALAEKGILEVEEEVSSNPKYFYTQKSVDIYRDFLDRIVLFSDIMKNHHLTRTLLIQLLEKNNLPFIVDEMRFTQRTFYVQKETYEALKEILHDSTQTTLQFDTRRKSDFCYKHYGLMQAFHYGKALLRLRYNDSTKQFGFYVPIESGFISLEDAIEDGAKPLYQLAKKKSRRAAYVELVGQMQNPALLAMIDLAYEQFGFKNMYIRIQNNNLHVFLKEGVLYGEFNTSLNGFEAIQWINGRYSIQDGTIEIIRTIKVHSIALSEKLSKDLQDFALLHNLTMNDVIQEGFNLLKAQFKKKG